MTELAIPLVDLKAQYNSLKDEIDAAIWGVIQNSQFILGEEVAAFESELATYCHTGYAIGVASGTDALHLALLASEIKPGDEVITTPFTFIATTEMIYECGARPVFVDIDSGTYNIDWELVEAKITPKTRAIIPVHLFGQPADMEPILELGAKYDLKVIEDCAQALGAKYKGRRVGSLGDMGCLSFFPSKMLGAYGDGGAVVTSNQGVAERIKLLRNHGGKQKYFHVINGYNSRLDSIQAAILRIKLRYLDDWIKQRCQKASLYRRLLGEIEGVELPDIAPDTHHVFNYYTIRLKGSRVSRDKLQEYLHSKGISTAIYYPLSLHLQEVYRPLGYKIGDFPESEKVQKEVLSLPIYPELSEKQIREIAEVVKEFIK